MGVILKGISNKGAINLWGKFLKIDIQKKKISFLLFYWLINQVKTILQTGSFAIKTMILIPILAMAATNTHLQILHQNIEKKALQILIIVSDAIKVQMKTI